MSLSFDIKKSFPAFDLEIALDADSETVGLLGGSGSGKSLTLRCLAGLETPDEGRIVVNETVFFDSAAKINLTPQKRKTAMLFQNYMLFPNLTAAENIAAGLPKDVSKADAKAIVEKQLEVFGLKGFGKRYPIRLSGGQQQRVALARMLVAQPSLLMLDEPFAALDSYLKSALEQEMLDLFENFRGTILYVSHDIDEAFRFCDRIAVLEHGRLAEIAPTDDIVSHPAAYATLKVSGVQNISAARYLDDHTVEACAWGLKFTTAQIVPRDVAYLGIRAAHIRQARNESANVFELEVSRISDSRFECSVVFKFPGSSRFMLWTIDKRIGYEELLFKRGDRVSVHIPPDCVHLVTR